MGMTPMQLFSGLNFWVVLAAAAASFVFGGIWYGALSRQWMEAANLTEEQIRGPAVRRHGRSSSPSSRRS